jgi:hypothetical protein
MNHINYLDFCENLFRSWNQDKLFLDNNFSFDLSALPEPYLVFGENAGELSFLTTNPGGVMDFQRKPSGFLREGEKYQALAKRLANHYEKTLANAAKTRIRNMYDLSKILKPKSDGFTQFEISPFHSSSFPDKEKFSKHVLRHEDNLHHEYISLLTDHLKQRDCICIQSGFPDLKRLNKKWLELISRILSVEKNDWQAVFFKFKHGRPTTGAFYANNQSTFKAILFNSAGNSSPSLETMSELFDLLKT